MQTSTIPPSIKSSPSNSSSKQSACANFGMANEFNKDSLIWKAVVTQYNKDPTSVYFIDTDDDPSGFKNFANIFNTTNFPTFPAYVIISSAGDSRMYGTLCGYYTIIQFNNPSSSSSSSSWSSTPIPSSTLIPSSSPPPIGKILQDYSHNYYHYIITSTGVEIAYYKQGVFVPIFSPSSSGLGFWAIIGILVGVVLGLFGFYKFYKWWKNRQETKKKTLSTASSTPASQVKTV